MGSLCPVPTTYLVKGGLICRGPNTYLPSDGGLVFSTNLPSEGGPYVENLIGK
jgi:hypothetical protein